MKYISSDTNIWIDFLTINELHLPFMLDYKYLMSTDMIDNELAEPENLSRQLLSSGLEPTEMSDEEFWLANEFVGKYRKPSRYDCVALAIAKNRNITLLSGDGPLRKAAEKENVKVMGTLGILEELYEQNKINLEKYIGCLRKLKADDSGKIRLPNRIIDERLEKLSD